MLKVNNVVLPTPADVDYEDDKIWSDNTGRLDNGYFVGELVCIKRKYVVKFPPLTPAQLSEVRTAFAAQFGSVEITDIGDDDNNPSTETVTLDAYFGDVKVKAYSWNNNIKYAVNCTVSIIER